MRLDSHNLRKTVYNVECYAQDFSQGRCLFRYLFLSGRLGRDSNITVLQFVTLPDIVFFLCLFFPEEVAFQEYQAVLGRFRVRVLPECHVVIGKGPDIVAFFFGLVGKFYQVLLFFVVVKLLDVGFHYRLFTADR